MTVRLEILHVPDCLNLAPMLARLRQVTDLPVSTREIVTETEAAAAGMAGSPTLLINGTDPFRCPDQPDSAIACRIYLDEHGQRTPAPSAAQLCDAVAEAGDAVAEAGGGSTAVPTTPGDVLTGAPITPGGVLSSWRTRALPRGRAMRAVHQAILRGFATTGHPPPAAELGLAAGPGDNPDEILATLHDRDAIRLDAAGRPSVAYPFSARPTRHRVRIDNGVDVYAMCAIDALGVAPMLDRDTRIESSDLTSGQPVIVTTTAGHSTWDPPGAVVFLGASAGGGPSADNCCGRLNFFTDETTAKTWSDAHPEVPGQILTHEEAEALGARLFGRLLRN